MVSKNSSLPGIRLAMLNWPPSSLLASYKVTLWPRSAAVTAQAIPAGPAPTMAMVFLAVVGSMIMRVSSHARGFTKQLLGLPLNTWSKQAWLQPIQVLIRSGVPAAALLTNSGSAKNGRAIEMRSASPLAKTFSATSGVFIRLEVMTGTVRCLRTV